MKRQTISWICNKDLYWEIIIRDNLTCQICGKKGRIVKGKAVCGKQFYKWIPMEIDHILSLYFNGNNGMDNLQLTCRRCNRKKGY